MDVRLAPGKYVVAVSGGVDSIVLLDVLRVRPELELVIAHFDHGIRADSGQDRRLVRTAAQQYGLPFEFGEGRLGPGVSEATARDVRYAFLRQVKAEHGARQIVTAHHQDDVIETAILNLLRGTGRKGLAALRSRDDIVRPLLERNKQEILAYARQRNLRWREDSTNTDQAFLRNYIRANLVPRLDKAGRQALLTIIATAENSNTEIERLLARALPQTAVAQLDRAWFTAQPHAVSREVMAAWLRQHGVHDFNRPLIERLVTQAKVAPPGKLADVNYRLVLHVGTQKLKLIPRLSSKRLSSV